MANLIMNFVSLSLPYSTMALIIFRKIVLLGINTVFGGLMLPLFLTASRIEAIIESGYTSVKKSNVLM